MSSEGWSIREGGICCWVLWLVWGRGMRFWTGENGGTSHGAGWKQMRKYTTVCVCARVVMGVIFAWSSGVGSWVGATELGSTGGQGEGKQEWRGPGGAGGGRGEQGPLCCAALPSMELAGLQVTGGWLKTGLATSLGLEEGERHSGISELQLCCLLRIKKKYDWVSEPTWWGQSKAGLLFSPLMCLSWGKELTKAFCNSLEFGGVFLRLPCRCADYSQCCEMAHPR